MYYGSGISHDQEFRSSLVGWLWFPIFHDAVTKMSAGVIVIGGLAGARELNSKEPHSRRS